MRSTPTRLIALVLVLALVLAACTSSGSDGTGSSADADADPATEAGVGGGGREAADDDEALPGDETQDDGSPGEDASDDTGGEDVTAFPLGELVAEGGSGGLADLVEVQLRADGDEAVLSLAADVDALLGLCSTAIPTIESASPPTLQLIMQMEVARPGEEAIVEALAKGDVPPDPADAGHGSGPDTDINIFLRPSFTFLADEAAVIEAFPGTSWEVSARLGVLREEGTLVMSTTDPWEISTVRFIVRAGEEGAAPACEMEAELDEQQLADRIDLILTY